MNETISDIEEVVKTVLFRNAALSDRISTLEAERLFLETKKLSLEAEKASLELENASLEAENKKLRAQLSRLVIPEKDSHNSSIPPAKESLKAQAVRRTNSLRTPTGRPSGGQAGHKGTTLLMRETADETKIQNPDYCTSCGKSLSEVSGKDVEIRQSIDIPLPVCPIVTNYVSIEKTCSCGKCNRGSFPSHVKPGVSYGVNLHALVAYLSTVQHIPFKRLTGILVDLYGIEISQGSVSNILNRMRKQSIPGYEAIRQEIEKSTVTGADETGEHLNGELHWMWVFQNLLATYIFQHPSRGKAAIDEHFPDGLKKSILVTDRHSSYFNMETEGHQICLAHLLRELIYLGELDKEQEWSKAMLNLLYDSIQQRKTISFGEIDIGSIKERFYILIMQDLSSLDKKFQSLQKSLNKHSQHLFQFLEHEDVPYENNASERSIRPLKVKQKVSGMFKSDNGADAFCQLYSIVDTARKNRQDPFRALIAVAENII
jgi:Transposase and inactivated derivatives